MTILAPLDAVAELFDRALPDGIEPDYSATVTASGGVVVDLCGDEPVAARVLVLGLIADMLGDDDGPEGIPVKAGEPAQRYTCGEFQGVLILVRTSITADQQAELLALARRIPDGNDGLV